MFYTGAAEQPKPKLPMTGKITVALLFATLGFSALNESLQFVEHGRIGGIIAVAFSLVLGGWLLKHCLRVNRVLFVVVEAYAGLFLLIGLAYFALFAVRGRSPFPPDDLLSTLDWAWLFFYLPALVALAYASRATYRFFRRKKPKPGAEAAAK